MNLSDVVDRMAQRTCRPRTEAARMASAMLDAIRAGLAEDGRVEIVGFGQFEFRQMPDRLGRDFKTGERIPVQGKRKVRFRESRSLPTGKRSPYDWRKRAHAADLPAER